MELIFLLSQQEGHTLLSSNRTFMELKLQINEIVSLVSR